MAVTKAFYQCNMTAISYITAQKPFAHGYRAHTSKTHAQVSRRLRGQDHWSGVPPRPPCGDQSPPYILYFRVTHALIPCVSTYILPLFLYFLALSSLYIFIAPNG